MTGMLWFDNSQDSLETKIAHALEYYKCKFGGVANVCFVHPSTSTGGVVAGIQVKPAKYVLPNHFYLGNEKTS